MRKIYLWLLLLCAMTAFVGCRDVQPMHQVVLKKGHVTYRGGYVGGRYHGFGVLMVGDSIVYEGEWRNGKREGKGFCCDSLGRRIVATWRNDTILSGRRVADGTVYEGGFNRRLIPEGDGTYTSASGSYYEGEVKGDHRHGFGFGIAPHNYARVGEWKHDVYKGERLTYTAKRVYGIDISRFQHDIGKHHYAINWNAMRIRHLGTISKKKVSGAVDYKVSFCYIKSTEGKTLRNKYYRSDYLAAHRHGIRTGSYHFFSTTSSASAQASYFLAHTMFRPGDLPPVLDVEPLPSQIEKMGGIQVLFGEIRTWMRIVRRRTGVQPVLYINQMFVNRYLSLAPDIKKNYDIWIARYGEYKPDIHLVYWQLSPDGRVAGIHGDVDINVFNGYQNEYREFLATKTIR